MMHRGRLDESPFFVVLSCSPDASRGNSHKAPGCIRLRSIFLRRGASARAAQPLAEKVEKTGDARSQRRVAVVHRVDRLTGLHALLGQYLYRSEEHTSELQSRE